MARIPEDVRQAWENRQGAVVFTTVDEQGLPNSIYATCVSLFGEDTVVVADNYFDKTRRNIKSGSRGSVLFITADNKAYQLKGHIEYHTSGAIFDDMKRWNPEKHPGHAAAALKVEEVFAGAKRLL